MTISPARTLWRATATLVLLPALAGAQTAPLNDTGQTQCYDAANTAVACTQAIAGNTGVRPGQDGRFGRDAAQAVGVLTKTGGGAGGFDFTRVCWNGHTEGDAQCTGTLVANGSGAASATPATDWACTYDNVTGLLWSLQTQTATWNAATAGTYPDAGHNSASRCGHASGWRLPTRRELLSIVHSGAFHPAIDTAYFPGTASAYYWSSEPTRPVQPVRGSSTSTTAIPTPATRSFPARFASCEADSDFSFFLSPFQRHGPRPPAAAVESLHGSGRAPAPGRCRSGFSREWPRPQTFAAEAAPTTRCPAPLPRKTNDAFASTGSFVSTPSPPQTMTRTTTFRTAPRARAAGWGLAAAALLAPAAWAAPFTVHSDGTVTDAATGLMWDRCAWGLSGASCATGTATPSTWAQALAAAQTANADNYKGHADWRLPNKNELESLVKIDASMPAIDTTAFPGTPTSGNLSVFRSSTTRAYDPSDAWAFEFRNGDTVGYPKTAPLSVRLVRSGQSFAPFDALDTTPPAITDGPSVTPGASGTTASASVTVDETATGHWLVLPAADVAPSAATLLATGAAVNLSANTAATVPLSSLAPGTAYVFYFIAQDAANNATSVSSTPFATPGLPAAPTGVTATPGAPGSGEITLSWTAPADNGSAITGYGVAVAPSGSCTPSPATATSCTATGLPNAASYGFTVTATNGVGTGPASGPASATLQGTQTITFADPGAQVVGTPLALSASATSGLTVSFAASGDCSLSGSTLNFTSPGTCTVTASQAGDGLWAAAADVAHGFVVALRSRSVAVPGGLATASFTGGGAACTFDSLVASTPATSGPAQPPADLEFPHGLLDFVLTGCDQSPVTMTLSYPQALAQGTRYWKLHAGAWARYPASVDEAAGTVVFTLVDGGAGDDDGAVNGTIVDPSGAAHPLATPIPTLGPWALALLGLLAAALGLRRLRRG